MSAALRTFAPGDEAKAIMQSIPGARFTPGMVVGFDGPGALGPEAAGAVMILHMTAVDEDATQLFFRRTNELKTLLPSTPGFIRMFSVFDGLSGYAVSFWRTPEDALAFGRDTAHRQVVREFLAKPFQYSQFVGVWSAHSVRRRHIYCAACGTSNDAPADACSHCHEPLLDVFKQQAAEVADSGVR
jgi:heme-degrading monooxygenase HmoA